MKKDFSYSGEYDWWLNKKAHGIAMHPKTLQFVDLMLRVMKRDENNGVLVSTRAKVLWEAVEENRYDNLIYRWGL